MAAPTTTRTDPGPSATSATSVSPVVELDTSYTAVSRGALVRRRFLRNKLAVFGVATLVLLYLAAFIGPYLIPFDYKQVDYTALLSPPSPQHLFGTTQIGQDVLAQTLRGLQKSLTIGLLVALGSTAIAAIVGSAAGYFGGWTDRTLMWVVDLLLVLPSFLIIAIASPALQGKSWLFLVLLLVVRAGREVHGHPGTQDHLQPHPAEHGVAAHHSRHHHRRNRHHRRNQPQLLRLRCATTGRLTGHPDRRRHRLGADLPVAVRLRTGVAGADGAVRQLRR